MLVKKYEKEDMNVCEKYKHCEGCPCFVDEKCVHPYVDEDEILRRKQNFWDDIVTIFVLCILLSMLLFAIFY